MRAIVVLAGDAIKYVYCAKTMRERFVIGWMERNRKLLMLIVFFFLFLSTLASRHLAPQVENSSVVGWRL